MANQSIVWNYINKKDVAIAVIRDYRNMQKIIDSTPIAIKEQEYKMTSIHGAVISDMPQSPRSPQNSDYKIVNCVDTKDILKDKYNHALEFFNWFNPAWNLLTSQEKYILDEFYGKGYNKGAAYKLSVELDFSDSSIYRIKDSALYKFKIYLIG